MGKLILVTTWVSTSKMCPSKISREGLLPLIQKISPLLVARISLPKSLFLITLVKFAMDTHLFLIVTLRILLANSLKLKKKLIVVLVRQLNKTQNVSRWEMLESWSWYLASPCVWSHSPTMLLWEDLLCVTWGKPLLLVLLKQSRLRTSPVLQPKQRKRPKRKNN